MNNEKIMLAHGGGGRKSAEFVNKYIVSRFANETLETMADSAKLKIGDENIFFTTDSYVVKPLFFNGGDIGTLAICGTVNDLAVCGGEPVGLSLALIIEEGLDVATLEKILDSAAAVAKEANVKILCGDTKTVDAGAVDKIFINTAGVGKKMDGADLSFRRIVPGDKIIVSGTIGDHGMTIMSQREGIKFESDLKSDCACVLPICKAVIETCGGAVKFMRDPTRGGVSATLNEIATSAGVDIMIEQKAVPVNSTTAAAAEMLGFDILEIANEGKVVIVVSDEKAEQCLEACRKTVVGKDAAIIGQVGEKNDEPIVELATEIGGSRVVQMPYGRELPRIC